jgi:hypothetical protein
MLRNIRGFSIASLRVAVRPRFPSRSVVPLIATGTFAAVAANHFLVSGCAQCLGDSGRPGDSSVVTRQISQVERTVKQHDLKLMFKVTSQLKATQQTVDELFPDDTELRATFNATCTDSHTFLETLALMQAALLEQAELKEVKGQYPEHVPAAAAPAAVSDVKDREEDDVKSELLDRLEGEYRAKQDKLFHRKQLPRTRLHNGVRSA